MHILAEDSLDFNPNWELYTEAFSPDFWNIRLVTYDYPDDISLW
jgi:hypothetical protein